MSLCILLTVCIAAFLSAFAFASSYRPDSLTVVGNIETTKPITLYIVGIPTFQYTLQKSASFSTVIPLLPNLQYRTEYVTDGIIVADKLVPTKGKVADLDRFVNEVTLSQTAHIQPQIQVNDEQVIRFLSK